MAPRRAQALLEIDVSDGGMRLTAERVQQKQAV